MMDETGLLLGWFGVRLANGAIVKRGIRRTMRDIMKLLGERQ